MFKKGMFTQSDVDRLNRMKPGDITNIRDITFITRTTQAVGCTYCCFSASNNGIGEVCNCLVENNHKFPAFDCRFKYWKRVDDTLEE